MTPGLRFAVGECTAESIRAHLSACDGEFHPALSARVHIDEYAAKLAVRAVTFEAWSAEVLVGLVAVYVAREAGTLYVSNVSVLPGHARRGIAGALLRRALEHGRAWGLSSALLEVSARNDRALRMYIGLGFRATGGDGDRVSLQLALGLRGEERQGEVPA
jgi:ribosomal protein S18 acetylase RimI-like enzyme